MGRKAVAGLLVAAVALAVACGDPKRNNPTPSPTPTDTPAPNPVIDALAPAFGIVTTVVTIDGSEFGADPGVVRFGTHEAGITSWSDTQIVATVPMAALPATYDVTVENSGVVSAPGVFEVILPPALYVNNNASPNDTVSAWSVATDGSLTSMTGSPYACGDDAVSYGGDAGSLVVHDGTRRVFASTDSGVAVFDVDPVTGELAAVAGSPFDLAGNNGPVYGIEVSADGTMLFAPSFTNDQIVVADIDVATGEVTPTSAFDTGTTGGVDSIVLGSGGSYLYSSDESGSFFAFSVGQGGALTSVNGSPFTHGGGTGIGVRLSPDGTHLYIMSDAVYIYDIATGTGIPTVNGNSPFFVTSPSGLSVSADGLRMWMVTLFTGTLTTADVMADGSVVLAPNSPHFLTDTAQACCTAVTHDQSLLFAIDGVNAEVGVYALDADGAPTALSGSPYTNPDNLAAPAGMSLTYWPAGYLSLP